MITLLRLTSKPRQPEPGTGAEQSPVPPPGEHEARFAARALVCGARMRRGAGTRRGNAARMLAG